MVLLDVMKYANFVRDVTITMLNEGKRSAEVCPKPEVFSTLCGSLLFECSYLVDLKKVD